MIYTPKLLQALWLRERMCAYGQIYPLLLSCACTEGPCRTDARDFCELAYCTGNAHAWIWRRAAAGLIRSIADVADTVRRIRIPVCRLCKKYYMCPLCRLSVCMLSFLSLLHAEMLFLYMTVHRY